MLPGYIAFAIIAQFFDITIDELLGFSIDTKDDMDNQMTYDRMLARLLLHGNAMMSYLECLEKSSQDDQSVSSDDAKKKIKLLKKILS